MIELRTEKPKRHAVLFLDIRGSTLQSKKATVTSETIAQRMKGLLTHFYLALEKLKGSLPTFIKSAGDGFMFVWRLPGNESALRVQIGILALACDLSKTLGENLKGLWNGNAPKIGIGLASGDVTRARIKSGEAEITDYFGFAANLAAKLQDSARPSGLVIHDEYLEAEPDLAAKFGLRRKKVPQRSTLAELGVAYCYISSDVDFIADWACLAWPGLAITDQIGRSTSDGRPSPSGLNTKGITVVTHQGLQGNLKTLEMWPRHVSREKGDRFKFIIDDFDALAMMYKRHSLQLVPREDLPDSKKDALSLRLCPDLLIAERAEDFLFVPIRCGVNALAVNQKFLPIIKDVRRYRDIRELIRSGRIRPDNIGFYDNIGATLPIILLMMKDDLSRDSVYRYDEGSTPALIRSLGTLLSGKKKKFRFYSKIETLAHDIQAGRIGVVLGGGAWLGTPEHFPGQVSFPIPSHDGGFLWVEGAAVTDGSDLETVIEFLLDSVLDEQYQRGLANGIPYGSSPVCVRAIADVQRSISSGNGDAPVMTGTSGAAVKPAREIDVARTNHKVIDSETVAIYSADQRLRQTLSHRMCPKDIAAWVELWTEITGRFCDLEPDR